MKTHSHTLNHKLEISLPKTDWDACSPDEAYVFCRPDRA